MRKTLTLALALGAAVVVGGCPSGGGGTGSTGSPEATSGATATATPTATRAATATPTATAAETAAGASAVSSASAAPSGAPSASASADPAELKKWDCGNKGQKACPMQGWMKSVMGSAASSGDAEKLAAALTTCAGKPVAGYGQWSAISQEGVAKAKAGDIDGAKKSCEKCHQLYKAKYQRTMRDKPW